MDVICPKCSSHHRAEPPSSLRARGAVRFRCTHCGNVFKVEFPSPGETLAPRPAEATPAPDAVERAPSFTVRAAGEVYPATELATLQRWILESRVKAEDQLSVDGERWERAGDRMELLIFFAAAERLHAPAPAARVISLPPNAQPVPKPVAVVAPPPPAFSSVASDPTELTDPEVGAGDDPVVDSVEEFWVDPQIAEPVEPALDDLPTDTVAAPTEPSVAASPGPAEPDEYSAPMEAESQEATLLAIFQERNEEVRKGPVPVRREYPPRATNPPPPSASSVPTSPPLSLQDMAAEFDMPSRFDDHSEEPAEEDAAPPANRAAGVLAIVMGAGIVVVLLGLGWYLSRPGPEPTQVAHAPPVHAPAPPEPPADAQPASGPPPQDGQVVADAQPAAAPVGADGQPASTAPVAPPQPAPSPAVTAPVVAAAPVAVAAHPAPVAAAVPAHPVVAPVVAAAAPIAAHPVVAAAPAGGTGFTSSADATKKGWALVGKAQYDQAYDLFSKALQRSNGDSSLLYGRGYAAEKQGNDVGAAADYCAAMAGKGADEGMKRELQAGLTRLHRTCPD